MKCADNPHAGNFSQFRPSFYSMHSINSLLSTSLLFFSLVYGADKHPRDLEVHFIPHDHADKDHHELHKLPHSNGHGAMPMSHFMKMFPMDIPPGAHVKVIHINPRSDSGEAPDFMGDGLINSILGELSGGFHSNLKPLLHQAQRASRQEAPHPCTDDIEKQCHDDHDHDHHHISHIHCLGIHAHDISDQCAEEIQHSLPFVCSIEISRFCSAHHNLEKSVLDCLDEHTKSPHFRQDCIDSLTTTRQLINRMNTQHVAIVDRRTGEIIKSTAAFVSTSVYVAMYVGIVALVAILLYAVWVRDDETSVIKSLQRTVRNLKRYVSGQKRQPIRSHVMEMKGGSNWSM